MTDKIQSTTLAKPTHGALAEAEAAFECIRLILVNRLEEPERSAFWKAVEARDAIRAVQSTTLAQPAPETTPLRLCGYCKSWNSKPCGEGCCWSPTDPTIEKVKADDLKAKRKHNRKHPLPVTFEG